MNLHGIVRPLITKVHPDEDCVLYQASGQTNTLGVVKPIYEAPQDVKIQWQPNNQSLSHQEHTNFTEIREQIYLYSAHTLPISGVKRVPILRGGDIVYRPLNQGYWLVTSVLEDWSADGWAKAEVTLQVTPPDFSASDWHGGT